MTKLEKIERQVEDIDHKGVEFEIESAQTCSMELNYPINLIGYEDGLCDGDVLSRHGEYLGTWKFVKDEEKKFGLFCFVADGEFEPKFSETVNLLDSGTITGLAMSRLCSSIRDWHEKTNSSNIDYS